ncbi:response regulator [Methylomonas rosea]|uniref:Response regulator n=1 Tax=Methylomonas rosea TaxID=2952227 RepID=A0ABT1TRF9_9GAMM|nr:HD domain-containing phosphohydrolase [Methylomonas sp. WSC-7]MCQ8117188.1 response regulator [Methylomonas sp. WSC-7]
MPHGPILIVDDEPSNLAILRQILQKDYSLRFAVNGPEALELVNKVRPSLILLDIQMPGMDGYQVCRALKADPKLESIPVIFVTSLAESGKEKEGFAIGCVDYLTKPVSADIVLARVKTHLSLIRATKLEDSYHKAIYMLGKAGHYNDTDTGLHIWRMAAYSRKLAEALAWDAEQCELLEYAAAMHDTGKIGIPDSILRKPGKLDADEWDIMKTHTQIGYEILSTSQSPLFDLAAEIALHHHEKWDGSGYPFGLSGLSIPESARIVAIADVFDALSMTRPYKNAWALDDILNFLKQGAGQHFDPKFIDCFMTILPEIMKTKANWEMREREAKFEALQISKPPA